MSYVIKGRPIFIRAIRCGKPDCDETFTQSLEGGTDATRHPDEDWNAIFIRVLEGVSWERRDDLWLCPKHSEEES